MEHDAEARRGFARMGFGCKHYRRRCRIRAPCCGDVFHCRHCHNESTKDGHELDRHAVHSVICLVCDTEQPVAQVCCNCGVCMGEYFCRTCKFFDDDVDKEHYHCKDCGICRVGGRENFFHCQKCGSCYSTTLREKHYCIENSMKNNCPICYEYLFDSLRETSVLRCGHTMHLQCFHEMLKHDKFSCPICSTSIFDMDKFLRALDAEMEASYCYMGKSIYTRIKFRPFISNQIHSDTENVEKQLPKKNQRGALQAAAKLLVTTLMVLARALRRDGSCATTAGTRRRSSPAWRGTSAATASRTTPAGSLPPSSRSLQPSIIVHPSISIRVSGEDTHVSL